MRFLLLAAVLLLTACGQVAQPDNGLDPQLLTAGPVPSPSPVPPIPAPGGPCLTVGAGQVEAALGHRASVVTMTNCDTEPVRVTGYPVVRLLDTGRAPMDVTVKHGSSYMAIDPGAKTVTVEPGGHALAVLSWSNTVTDGDSATGAYAQITPIPGAAAQTVPLDTDLGTTGELTVTAWALELPH
ncbi:DUF4232 domain-containing protein [Amycolatopsis sp. GM8]|uniref:DUF4232 domain-containing protein n=1 Tax=Amycolatopsis sp. GM8 TaxID=2896530 RepID=UPI001F2F6E91|nr:DUF4232 domain-containing protein [Amycolatopsis sp. GM8]